MGTSLEQLTQRDAKDLDLQIARMKEDIQKHGYEKQGVYKNVGWYMVRPGGGFWRGYIEIPSAVQEDKELMEAIENETHCGFTGSPQRNDAHHYKGFDCGHIDDFVMVNDRPLPWGTFRDHDYVMERLKAMIDVLVTSQQKQ